MKKLLALAVIATALFTSNAYAAAVNIFVQQRETSPGSGIGIELWDITATTEGGTTLGGIALLGNTLLNNLVTNAANPAISALDSGLVVDVLGDGTTSAMSINNTGTGVVILQGGTDPGGLLGTITVGPLGAPGTNYGNLRGGDELYGYTAVDASGATVADVSLTIRPVPEPVTVLLLGFGLAGIALVRRQA